VVLTKGAEHVVDMSRLVRRLRRFRPDVVHFQWCSIPLVDLAALRRIRRFAPVVLTVHDVNLFYGGQSSPLQLMGWRTPSTVQSPTAASSSTLQKEAKAGATTRGVVAVRCSGLAAPPAQGYVIDQRAPLPCPTSGATWRVGSALPCSCTFLTSATDLSEWLTSPIQRLGGQLVQAEDEIAAINMVLGASFGGIPSLTATSGPGYP
jgi:hypothetical protein